MSQDMLDTYRKEVPGWDWSAMWSTRWCSWRTVGDDLLADLPWTGSRSARVRLEGLVAAAANSGNQRVQPAPGDAVGLGDFGRAAFLDEHRVDHIPLQSHPGTSFR